MQSVQEAKDDRELVHSVISALTQLVVKTPQQTLGWTDSQGNTGAQVAVHLVELLLDPQDAEETGGLVLGGLLLALIRKGADQLGSTLLQLLPKLPQRLATSSSMSLSQSLIIPLAFLMCDRCPDILQTLEAASVETPSGRRQSLEVFASKWVQEAPTIQGSWARKANLIALCNLFRSGHPLLTSLKVQGELLPDDSGLIVTRSRAKTRPDRYSQVLLGAKILSLILEEWRSSGEASAQRADRSGDNDEDDDGWDDEDEGGDDNLLLSDALGLDLEELTMSDDPFTGLTAEELQHDPINQIDTKSHIASFLKEQSSSATAAAIFPQLDQSTVTALQSALASIS